MNLDSLKIDDTTPAAAAEPNVLNFELYRHNTLKRQMPNYVGSELHAQIRASLAAQGITIK